MGRYRKGPHPDRVIDGLNAQVRNLKAQMITVPDETIDRWIEGSEWWFERDAQIPEDAELFPPAKVVNRITWQRKDANARIQKETAFHSTHEKPKKPTEITKGLKLRRQSIKYLRIEKQTRKATFYVTSDSTFLDSMLGYWVADWAILADNKNKREVVVDNKLTLKEIPFN